MGQRQACLAQCLHRTQCMPQRVAVTERAVQFSLQGLGLCRVAQQQDQLVALVAHQQAHSQPLQALLPVLRQFAGGAREHQAGGFQRAVQLYQAFLRGAFGETLLQQVIQ